jgi:hypothetical protein
MTIIYACSTGTGKKTINLKDGNTVSFYVVTDIGRNGYYRQKNVADQMGKMSESIEPDFIISSGDCFHGNGIRSISDPMWMSNFENIYTHPSLHCDWYPVLGNHEYHGNTQAVLDYSTISRRWNMPGRYYTIVKEINDSCSLRLIYIDTTPFSNEYRSDSIGYPDAGRQDLQKQIEWIDSVLSCSKEKWKIVTGHHPVFSIDKKHGSTLELVQKLNPVMIKYKVDAYLSGHIHNFQHLRIPGSDIDYIITSSGSLARPCYANDSTKFTSSDEGFTICSASEHKLVFRFVNSIGEPIYQYVRER